MLTLSCDGDLNFSSTTKQSAPTTTLTTMKTTQRTTTQFVTTTTAKTPAITMTASANVKTNLQFTTIPGSGTSNIATTKTASIKTTRTEITQTIEMSNQENTTISPECTNLLYSHFSVKTSTAEQVKKVQVSSDSFNFNLHTYYQRQFI